MLQSKKSCGAHAFAGCTTECLIGFLRGAVVWTSVLAWSAVLVHADAEPRKQSAVGELVPFDAAPYPFTQGQVPPSDGTLEPQPFFHRDVDGRLYHTSPRGGQLFEDQTYHDNRSLLYVPPRFDPRGHDPFILLFLHGNLATLGRDVARRQRVPEQVLASRKNAVLIAPQLAVDALDSSPGHFYEPDFLEKYLHEAALHLAARFPGRLQTDDLDRLPVVIAAYSGGYLGTAFSLQYAMPPRSSRIVGVILLDALFGEEHKFEDWIMRPESRDAFFVSAYSKSSAPLNTQLEDALRSRGLKIDTAMPATIGKGDVIFRAAPTAVHNDFVTQAWVRDPLADILSRVTLDQASSDSRP